MIPAATAMTTNCAAIEITCNGGERGFELIRGCQP